MAFTLFEQPCTKCGKPNLGPRLGGKARGQWLGYDECHKCRRESSAEQSA